VLSLTVLLERESDRECSSTRSLGSTTVSERVPQAHYSLSTTSSSRVTSAIPMVALAYQTNGTARPRERLYSGVTLSNGSASTNGTARESTI
jgi:hypothetical protein